MKINELKLQNFKCFDDQEFELASPYTLIIGNNGKGKTAILDAIAVGISSLLSHFNQPGSSRSLEPDDVRLEKYQQGEASTLEPQYPSAVTCEGIFEEQELTWTQSWSDTDSKPKTDKTIEKLSQKLHQISEGRDGILPLVAYYATDRLWIPKPKKEHNISLESRSKGYVSCFHPDSNVKSLIELLKREEQEKLKSRKSSHLLQVVKSAIAECMKDEDWDTITYSFGQEEVLAQAKDGRLLPIRLLSDGVRNILVTVADIASRAAILNPQLGENAAKETPGIVLIDEIDLHLHPSWQRRVVEALHRTFPKLQFIATTHSPFIIQSLRPKLGKLLNLDTFDLTSIEANESIEDLTEDQMGVELPQQSERYQKMEAVAEEYLQLLGQAQNVDAAKLQEIEEKLDQLIIPYTDDPVYMARLQRKRIVAGLGKEEAK